MLPTAISKGQKINILMLLGRDHINPQIYFRPDNFKISVTKPHPILVQLRLSNDEVIVIVEASVRN